MKTLDLAFNAPGSWGFCKMCAWTCTVDPDTGLIVRHRRVRNGHEDALCCGGEKPPHTETPETAQALKQVSFRKEIGRAQRRAHWQRRRWHERERTEEEREMEAEIDAAVAHNESTIIGPIDLQWGDDDDEDDDN
jgi:hypothetical protein